MTASSPTIVLHPSRTLRAYGLWFGAAWCAVVVSGLIIGLGQSSDAAAVWVMLLVLGLVIVWRTVGTRVVLCDDMMRIRNFWRTTVILRGQIVDFRTGEPIVNPFGAMVHVAVRGPSLFALEATRSTTFDGQIHTKLCVQQLNAWLAAPESDPT